jgi:hypothetical protein
MKQKETTACHDTMEADLQKIEPNLGEKETVVEQEIPNEEDTSHFLTACQEGTKANPEKMEPTDRAKAILKQMIAIANNNQEMMNAMDFTGNLEEMERESEH